MDLLGFDPEQPREVDSQKAELLQGLPLVSAVATHLDAATASSVVRSLLTGVGRQASGDSSEDAETLEIALSARGFLARQLAPAGFDGRAARMHVRALLEAPVRMQPAPVDAGGRGAGQTDEVSSLAAALLEGQSRRTVKGEEQIANEAVLERLAAVMNDAEALATLNGLSSKEVLHSEERLATQLAADQQRFPHLAELLHTSGIKVPAGALPACFHGVVSNAEVVATANNALRVQEMAPRAIMKVAVKPYSTPAMRQNEAQLLQLTRAAWFGQLVNAPSAADFGIADVVSGCLASVKGLLGKTNVDDKTAVKLLVQAWPAIALAVSAGNPTDGAVQQVASQISALAFSDVDRVSQGVKLLLIPFLVELRAAWDRFQRGCGAMPVFALVWEATQRLESVAAYTKTLNERAAGVGDDAAIAKRLDALEAANKQHLEKIETQAKALRSLQPKAAAPSAAELKAAGEKAAAAEAKRVKKAEKRAAQKARKAAESDATANEADGSSASEDEATTESKVTFTPGGKGEKGGKGSGGRGGGGGRNGK
jgi:hypothetical protein